MKKINNQTKSLLEKTVSKQLKTIQTQLLTIEEQERIIQRHMKSLFEMEEKVSKMSLVFMAKIMSAQTMLKTIVEADNNELRTNIFKIYRNELQQDANAYLSEIDITPKLPF